MNNLLIYQFGALRSCLAVYFSLSPLHRLYPVEVCLLTLLKLLDPLFAFSSMYIWCAAQPRLTVCKSCFIPGPPLLLLHLIFPPNLISRRAVRHVEGPVDHTACVSVSNLYSASWATITRYVFTVGRIKVDKTIWTGLVKHESIERKNNEEEGMCAHESWREARQQHFLNKQKAGVGCFIYDNNS